MKALMAAGAAITVVASACARPNGQAAQQSAAPACTPTLDSLRDVTTLAALAGSYRLQLVTGSGPRTSGTIELTAHGRDSLRGRAVIALDSVGATAPGARDRNTRHDVIGLLWGAPTSPRVTIRFGALAAPPGAQPIEGTSMVLHLRAMGTAGFKGEWSSSPGDAMSRGVSGYFCADR